MRDPSGLRVISTGRADAEPTSTPKGLTPAAWLQCWADVRKTLNEEARTATVSNADYECLRWLLLQACGQTYAMRANFAEKGFASQWGRGFSVNDFSVASADKVTKHCEDARHTPEFRALHADLMKQGAQRWRP